jgi:drug/metabolite transporter (DMT)-like permease
VTAQEVRGSLWGLLGVTAFSLTLPATRAAVPYLGVAFVFLGRVAGAGLAAALILWLSRQTFPRREDWPGLIVTALGVVLGFPFLTTLALNYVPASHGAIVVGLLPISTAVAGAVLTGERPNSRFWLASGAATVIVIAFILQSTDGRLSLPDAALVGAVFAAACGYAKGAQLAGRLGGWQVICWSLVIALPLTATAAVLFVTFPQGPIPAGVARIFLCHAGQPADRLFCLVLWAFARRDRARQSNAAHAAVLHSGRVGMAARRDYRRPSVDLRDGGGRSGCDRSTRPHRPNNGDRLKSLT